MTISNSKQLRHVFRVTSGATPDSGKAEYWGGDILWATPEDVGSLEYYWLRDTRRKITQAGYDSCGATAALPGAIILTKRAPIGQVAVLASETSSNQGCFLLTPRKETDTRFFYYWLSTQTPRLQILGRGSTFMELSTDELKSLRIPHPELPQQRAIADYLDRETSKLDAFIAAKQRLLELLAEKRRAIITHAVTRGLNPNTPLRDSEIPWLGQIPKHWEITPLFTIARERNDRNSQGSMMNVLSLSYGRIIRRDISENFGLMPKSFDTYQIVSPDNIVLRLTDLQNDKRSLRVGLVEETGIITSAYVSLKVLACVVPLYAFYLLHSYDITKVFYALGAGIRQTMTFEDLKRMPVLVPDEDEQRAIVAHIQKETSKIDALSEAAKKTIALLKERRAALISAAVTGKINCSSAIA